MNRNGLVLIGFAVAILGYAVLYSGISDLNPCITPDGNPAGILHALSPAGTSLLAPAPVKAAA